MHLVVCAPAATPPGRGVLVSGMTLHALDPERWILEIDGAELRDGQPGARLRGATLHVSPVELVERCVAAVGPERDSHLGVRTRALLFDGLELVS
jgi:hypothetical protein